jgi:protein-disulfide isomerase
MNKRQGWLIALLVVALLVAACGPQMATPTPAEKTADKEAATEAPAAETPDKAPTTVEEEKPTQEANPTAGSTVSSDDWRVLGSPDAPVTIIEYSDFQ